MDYRAKPATEPSPRESGQVTWHAAELQAILEHLNSNRSGLTEDEAEIRLQKHGPNQMPRVPPPTLWQIVARQFKSPLIYVLGIAAAFSLMLGEVKDASFICGVLIINAIIGTFQESRAEKASEALRKLLTILTAVVRNGQTQEIEAEQLVPGDIVHLESGNRVPADIRLITAHGLEVDESLLTGESTTVAKSPQWTGSEGTALADRLNMVYAASMVVRGRCEGIVVSTGSDSEVGKLALDVLMQSGGRPPLVERMEVFTKWIAIAVLSLATIVGFLGTLFGGYSPTEMFMFGVALAVSAIPEGLPVALTVALAVGTTRMARRGVIVRRLTAVEGLGSCTLIASDKTGTLTCNELTVREVRLPDGRSFDVTGEGFIPEGHFTLGDLPIEPDTATDLGPLARAVVLCNEADLLHSHDSWAWHGDPTDVALLSMAYKLGWRREVSLDRHPLLNEIPFEADRRFAATFHRIDDTVRVMVKGAPERIFDMCSVSGETLQKLKEMSNEMATQGYRVLAIAEGSAPSDLSEDQVPPAPEDLDCLGLVGMIDPLRSGAREAVAAAKSAGVRTVMVTGDHPVTALAIARDLGLADAEEHVLTGSEMSERTPEELGDDIRSTHVFARIAPHQKLEIVEAARAAGDYVAVTGDGANDAPALRTSNIGVAMGKAGTDVAREASDLVISDDHFATITAGIEEGRIAYNNIRKVIYLLISTGAAEVVLVALAIASGLPIPLLPVQLLWLNLVTNGIQDVTLAFEPGVGNVLERKPRPPSEPIFNRLMIERTLVGALTMGIVAFILFQWLLAAGWEEYSARNALLLLMVLFENVHIFNSRSETRSAFALSPLRNPILMVGMVVAFSIHVAMLYLPWGNILLSTEPVSFDQWKVLIMLSLSLLVVMELHKLSWWARGEKKTMVVPTSNTHRQDA
ncbi:MAG: cation-translocating P-type ATPase [Gammaproteobacteria bacterium]